MIDQNSRAYINFTATYGEKARFNHICQKIGESGSTVMQMMLKKFIDKYDFLLEDFDLYAELRKIEERKNKLINEAPKELKKRQEERKRQTEVDKNILTFPEI